MFPTRILVVVLLSTAAVVAQEAGPLQSTTIVRGELVVTFRDNSNSPQVLSGIDSLFNVQRAPGFDAYDPDSRGASAGLNFEHIISGHRSRHNKFTPRQGDYALRLLPDEKSVTLTRRAADSPWRVASTLKYTVTEPHYVDFEFSCAPRDASLFGPRGYALFFFANYMNDVEDAAVHFLGKPSEREPETWITADAPAAHPDWNQGGNYRAVAADDLGYDDDVQFRLNTWSYNWPRITRPFYYGRAGRGMTLILMFDRLHSARDQIRFSLYKFKLQRFPRPAWDFQYVVNRVAADQQYGFRGRLVWKKFISQDDCLREYQTWAAQQQPRIRAERIQQLKQLNATVFVRERRVVEVNANGTNITDVDLDLVGDFDEMTDLSLERTRITDAGLVHLKKLKKLEWLNLYRSRVGDGALKVLAQLPSLQHLPVGATNVSDAGLKHLREMKQLRYLGLRGNDVSDDGTLSLGNLVNLRGLHLGETGVSDHGLVNLLKMSKLEKLWLDDTAVSDKAIGTLARLKSLRELHVARTKITEKGLVELRDRLPQCRVIDH